MRKKRKLCLDWICPLRKPDNKILFKFIKGLKNHKGIKDINFYCISIDCEKPLVEVNKTLEKGYKEFRKELAKIVKELLNEK